MITAKQQQQQQQQQQQGKGQGRIWLCRGMNHCSSSSNNTNNNYFEQPRIIVDLPVILAAVRYVR